MCIHGLYALFHNESIPAHLWTNQSLIKYSIMETPWRRHVFACTFKQLSA